MVTTFLMFCTTVLSAAPARRDDEGQGTLEYIGIVVIAALLVGAIFTAVSGADIGSVIADKLSEITGIGG